VALKQTFYQLAREKIDKGIQAKEFSDSIKDVVVYVDQIDKQTKQWRGVFIADHRDRHNPLTIISQSGGLTADLDKMTVNLVLRNGSIHRHNEAASQTISFDSYNLQLPLAPGPPTQTGQKSDLPPAELLARAAEFKAAAEKEPARRNILLNAEIGMRIEFHQRFALSVGCLILTILALPLALQSKPGRGKAGLPLGLFFFFLYYILFSFAESLAETSGMPIAPLIWAPNLIFAVLTWFIIRAASRENSVKIFDRLTDSYTHLRGFAQKIGGRRA
jgi:lipopolysaccharide export system permease protein